MSKTPTVELDNGKSVKVYLQSQEGKNGAKTFHLTFYDSKNVVVQQVGITDSEWSKLLVKGSNHSSNAVLYNRKV